VQTFTLRIQGDIYPKDKGLNGEEDEQSQKRSADQPQPRPHLPRMFISEDNSISSLISVFI
jgi:hypothetical protein